MNGRRTGARALILLDLTFLAACLVVLANVVAMSLSSGEATTLPRWADARLLAMELAEASRLAIDSGQPVQVEFARDAQGAFCGYRIVPQTRYAEGYQFVALRQFAAGAQVECSVGQLAFLPNGQASSDLSVTQRRGTKLAQVDVATTGEVRILADSL